MDIGKEAVVETSSPTSSEEEADNAPHAVANNGNELGM